MAMFGSMALSGLGQMGNMWFQSQMMDKQNNFQMQYMDQLMKNQYNNALGLQENYQNWYGSFMEDLTTMKFNQSLEMANYQAELRGMNTPSALMASHATNSGNETLTSLYPNFISASNARNQHVQTRPETHEAGNDAQSDQTDFSTYLPNSRESTEGSGSVLSSALSQQYYTTSSSDGLSSRYPASNHNSSFGGSQSPNISSGSSAGMYSGESDVYVSEAETLGSISIPSTASSVQLDSDGQTKSDPSNDDKMSNPN